MEQVPDDNASLALARKLCPELSEKEVREQAQHLDDYIAVLLRIFERIYAEETDNPQSHSLTDNPNGDRFKPKGN